LPAQKQPQIWKIEERNNARREKDMEKRLDPEGHFDGRGDDKLPSFILEGGTVSNLNRAINGKGARSASTNTRRLGRRNGNEGFLTAPSRSGTGEM